MIDILETFKGIVMTFVTDSRSYQWWIYVKEIVLGKLFFE